MLSGMKITRLKPGERAPDTADRIHINSFPDGKNGWTGALGLAGSALFGVSKNEHRSIQEAEAEAIEWARQNGIEALTIEFDDA